MNILYLGDVMGEAGVEVVEKLLPDTVAEHKADLVIAQAENVSEGKGITIEDYERLKAIGIDFFTGGNWSLQRKEIWPLLSDPNEPILRPANYPKGTAGLGYKYISKNNQKVLVISLLGQIVGKDSDKPLDNPLRVVDSILESAEPAAAIVINFHGDYSSEKVIIGHYLDGRATAVIGDHWHVPTADEQVLPKGTAHITDVGMCGALNASLGIALDSVIPRWRDGLHTRNQMEKSGPRQFNAVLIKSDQRGLATSMTRVQKYLDT